MDDVVAVALTLATGEKRYVMTWGRIQSGVDPEPLAALVLGHAARFGLTDAMSAEVCPMLRDARDAPYFYESLIRFGQRPIPFGDGYEAWRSEMAERMAEGRELSYLGDEPGAGLASS